MSPASYQTAPPRPRIVTIVLRAGQRGVTTNRASRWRASRASAQVAGREPIAQMIAEKVERHHGQRKKKPGEKDPGIVFDILRIHRLAQQVAPARGRLLDAESEQRKRALAEHVAGNRKGGIDRRKPEHRGYYVAREDSRTRAAEGAASDHERFRANRRRHPANHPREARPTDEG